MNVHVNHQMMLLPNFTAVPTISNMQRMWVCVRCKKMTVEFPICTYCAPHWEFRKAVRYAANMLERGFVKIMA